MKDIIGIVVAVAGVVAAFLSWQAAARAADVARDIRDRTLRDVAFREYERYILAHTQTAAELAVFLAHCDRIAARIRSEAIKNGVHGGSRAELLLADVENHRQVGRTCQAFLAAEAALRQETALTGDMLTQDYRQSWLLIEKSRTSLGGELNRLLVLDKSLDGG